MSGADPATFAFVVPVRWFGPADAPHAQPRAWLSVLGHETDQEAEAARFRARLFPTMRDEIAIEGRLDEVNGGVGNTVDLDVAIDRTRTALRRRLERDLEPELWPDGRPDELTPQQSAELERLMGVAYFGDAYQKDRLVLERMIALRERQRVAAEWPVLIVSPPEGWEDVAERPLRAGYVEAIARAYMRARQEAEVALGKQPRSGP